MPLSNWPTLADDSGTGTDGTALDRDLFNDAKASIEDSIFSATNPTISPADTTDEVVTARGIYDVLNDRLNVIEGNVGGITTPTTSSFAASDNLVLNPDLKGWKSGSALAPDSFTLSGTGAAVARCGPAESDTTTLNVGHTAKVTFGSDTAKLTQTVIATADFSAHASVGLDGRKFALTVRVQASIVDLVRIAVTDGVTTTNSAYHTGSGNPENLTVVHTLSASATKLEFYVEVVQAGSAYFGGFVGTFADSPAPSWTPSPRYGHRVLDINVTPAATAGAPEIDLMTYKASPNLLRHNGTTIHILAMGTTAANATLKTLKFKFGSVSLTLFAAGHNNKSWKVDVYIFRVDAATQHVFVHGTVGTTNIFPAPSVTAAEDETAEILLRFTGDANAANDIVQRYMLTEIIEPGGGL